MSELYKGKSVAEQQYVCLIFFVSYTNSIEFSSLDLSWTLLMSDKFQKLRNCMFVDQSELLRFRQVLVNVVLATDIFDKELNDLRRNRWNKAFAPEVEIGEQSPEYKNELRGTIVIEHIIQASDVSHCMVRYVQNATRTLTYCLDC